MARDTHEDVLEHRHLQPWSDLSPADAESEANPWAWLDRPEEAAPPARTADASVLAVLVTLDAARWLPETLAGLAALEPRPTRLIAIDNQSTDATRALLDRAQRHGLIDAVYEGRRSFGFGAAVAAAVEQDVSARPATGPAGAYEWLWLLHDDAVPAPDALGKLLGQVTTAAKPVDITGPKLLLPSRRHAVSQLSEVGTSISGTGRRELELDPGEVDQGQRDEPVERLGVSTCGMLVRASVWEQLGGLDPAIPVFRDGVEFGWRAHLAGFRVLTTPSARFTHRQVGRAGLRPRGLAGRRPGVIDRHLGMVVVAAHASRLALPLVWLRLVWSCVLHAVGYLLGKVPGRAVDEVLAAAAFVRSPGRIRALRRRVRSQPATAHAHRVVRQLRPPWWSSLRVAAEAISGALSDRYREVAGDGEAASLDELTGDDFSTVAEEKKRSPWLSPVALTAVLAVAGCLVAARHVLGTGSLTAPALLPAPASLQALWQSVWQPIPGAPGQSSPPWLALLAVGSTVLAGRPEWLTTVLLLGVVPLALLAAYPVLRRLVRSRGVRLWAAATYALLPVLLGGTNQGRLALSIVALGLPLLALAVRALALRRPRSPEAWRGAWGAGVVLVALVAFEPSLIVCAALAGALGALALRRTPRKAGRVGIALAVPLVVLAPWWPSVITSWGRLLVGPDAALTGAPAAARVWQLFLGREAGPGLPPLWLSAAAMGCIWLVALVGLARRPRSRAVRAAWVTALLGLALAVALSRLVVPVPPVGVEVRPWVGAYLLLCFGALLLAGAVGVDGLVTEVRRRSFSWLQPATVVASAAVALISVLGAGWWMLGGAAGPLERQRLDAIPPYVVNAMRSDARVRVLAIQLQGQTASYFVLADDQPRLGDADRGFTFGGSSMAADQVADLVLRLTAGSADADIVPQLRDLGIGYLWLAGADEDTQARVDNTPGLGAASGNAQATVWQLEPPSSRLALVDGSVHAPLAGSPVVLPPGSPGRLLLLGEAADGRWQATLNGQRLDPVRAGWQQGFALPPEGGAVQYSLRSVTRWLLPLQAIALLAAIVLAAPAIRRPEVRDPTKYARRAATMAGSPR